MTAEEEAFGKIFEKAKHVKTVIFSRGEATKLLSDHACAGLIGRYVTNTKIEIDGEHLVVSVEIRQ